MLRLGIPNGSLYDSTIKLLEKIGINILASGRQFKISVKGIGLFEEALIMRSQDIPEAVVDGVIDCGICGWDCVAESAKEDKVVCITELWYGKKTRNATKVVIIGKTEELCDDPDILVAAEYPHLARGVFKKAQIRFSHGGTEQKVAYAKKYKYGVCVTETGQSIIENGLRIVKVLLKSPTVIIARERSDEIRKFGELMLGGLNAEQYLLIKMNVDTKAYPAVIPVIQALESPTINVLKRGGYAVEAVVKKRGIADLIMMLKEKGASGIITQDIGIIV